MLRLKHGKVNALDIEFCEMLAQSLDEIGHFSVKAVVLTGSGSTFCAGVDLFRLLDGGQEYVHQFIPVMMRTLERLFVFPKPVVAALNGSSPPGDRPMKQRSYPPTRREIE